MQAVLDDDLLVSTLTSTPCLYTPTTSSLSADSNGYWRDTMSSPDRDADGHDTDSDGDGVASIETGGEDKP